MKQYVSPALSLLQYGLDTEVASTSGGNEVDIYENGQDGGNLNWNS